MNGNYEKKELPRGRARARARSMLFSFKNTGLEQENGVELKHDHLSSEHSDEGTVLDVEKSFVAEPASIAGLGAGQVDSSSPFPALTIGIHAANAGLLVTSQPIVIKRSGAMSVNGSSSACYPADSGSDSEDSIPDIVNSRGDLRKWCTGQPPKTSFLGSDGQRRIPFTRRSTLAEKPELDILLAATKVNYKDHGYLPLSVQTIHRLSPYWKGEKPIADTKVFKCIKMDQEINGIHADHVVAALERIGAHCKHLLVVSPIQTSELGNVFNREAGNVALGNDWEQILNCFPNVKRLVFVHLKDEPVMLSRGTFYALHTAVANRQAAHELKSFSCEGPPQLITNFHYDLAVAHAAAAVAADSVI